MNSNDKVLDQPENMPEAGGEDHQTGEEAVAQLPASEAIEPATEQSTVEDTSPAPALPAMEAGGTGTAVVDQAATETGEVVQEGPTDEELFLAALEGEMPAGKDQLTPQRGQIVRGIVTAKTDSEILVDIGTKSEGVITGREMEVLDEQTLQAIEVGQEIAVYVLTPEDREGHPQLSLRRAMEEKDWLDAEQSLQTGQIHTSKIVGHNKGGLLVPFGKVRGFVPASHISQARRRNSNSSTPDQRWGGMVGDTIHVKVVEVDRRRNRLILSERAADEELRVQRRAERLASLEVGQVLRGRVISLAEFGAFVDLDGIDGLVHLSELSWRPVAHPREVLKIGDEIDVEVISIDRDRQRVGLSYKRCLEDPWDVLAANYHAGQLVQGTITKMTKFGAFARLIERPEIEGLIHISELAEHRVRHPREVVQEGEVVTLRVLRIDAANRRLALSIRQVNSEEYMDDDWRAAVDAAQAVPPVVTAPETMPVEVAEPSEETAGDAEAPALNEPSVAEVPEPAHESGEPDAGEIPEEPARESEAEEE